MLRARKPWDAQRTLGVSVSTQQPPTTSHSRAPTIQPNKDHKFSGRRLQTGGIEYAGIRPTPGPGHPIVAEGFPSMPHA